MNTVFVIVSDVAEYNDENWYKTEGQELLAVHREEVVADAVCKNLNINKVRAGFGYGPTGELLSSWYYDTQDIIKKLPTEIATQEFLDKVGLDPSEYIYEWQVPDSATDEDIEILLKHIPELTYFHVIEKEVL